MDCRSDLRVGVAMEPVACGEARVVRLHVRIIEGAIDAACFMLLVVPVMLLAVLDLVFSRRNGR